MTEAECLNATDPSPMPESLRGTSESEEVHAVRAGKNDHESGRMARVVKV
jgi:hypothetical protein